MNKNNDIGWSRISIVLAGYAILIILLAIPYQHGWSDVVIFEWASDGEDGAVLILLMIMYVEIRIEKYHKNNG